MNHIFKQCFYVLAFLLSSTVATAQTDILVDKVVAVIGDRPILMSNIEEQFNYMRTQQPGIPDEARCMVLDQLIGQELLLVQAQLDSVEVSDIEVEGQLEARVQQIMAYMGGDVAQFEAYYGMSVNEVKDNMREELRDQITLERMRSTVLADVRITPSEVKEFYNSVPKDSLPYLSSEVEVAEIEIRPQVSVKAKQDAINQLKSIKEQIVSGDATFADMAELYSDDPGSARQGGDLGWVSRGSFVPEFEAAAFNLRPNEYSQIVESDFGMHLIQLLERRGNNINARHILIKPKLTDEDRIDALNLADSVYTLITGDSLEFERAVAIYSDENAQTRNYGGRLINAKNGTTYFETADLDVNVYFSVDTLEVGELTIPVEHQDEQGNESFKLYKMISRTEPHQMNLGQDYDRIRQVALENKKAYYIEKWARERLGDTYINISDEYDACGVKEKWIQPSRSATGF